MGSNRMLVYNYTVLKFRQLGHVLTEYSSLRDLSTVNTKLKLIDLEFRVAFLIKKNSSSTTATMANSSGTQVPRTRVPWET